MPLPDGESVYFRPVSPLDRQALKNGMSALSPQTRYYRFFSPIANLSNEQLHYFTVVDQHHHVAWIALAENQAVQTALGIARFILIQQQPNIAEFALVVVDSFQQRGLGTILLAILYKMAIANGIEILRAYMLPENTVMCNWLAGLGAVGEYQNGHYRMNLTVSSKMSSESASASLQHLYDYIVKMSDNN